MSDDTLDQVIECVENAGPMDWVEACSRMRALAAKNAEERDEARGLCRELMDKRQAETGGDTSYHDYLDEYPWLAETGGG